MTNPDILHALLGLASPQEIGGYQPGAADYPQLPMSRNIEDRRQERYSPLQQLIQSYRDDERMWEVLGIPRKPTVYAPYDPSGTLQYQLGLDRMPTVNNEE